MKVRPSPQVEFGGEPVHPEVACGAVVRDEGGVAKVVQLGSIGVVVVGDFGVDHLGVLGAGVEQELLNLVAANVTEDAAVLLLLKEPGGAGGGVQPVGPMPMTCTTLPMAPACTSSPA